MICITDRRGFGLDSKGIDTMIHRARLRRIVLISLLALASTTLPAAAGVITYRVLNHPDGNAIGSGETVFSDGYVLRLDFGGDQHTFNANTTTGVFFSFEVGGTTAKMHGTVMHNESGSDQLWELEALFSGLQLGTNAPTWYDSETMYDDIIDDLKDHADFPDTAAEKSIVTDFGIDRIYFEKVDLILKPLTMEALDYPGPQEWNEHPDTGQFDDDKFFYLQYRWRLWDGQYAAYDAVAGAGWLEPSSGDYKEQNIAGSQDFLFILGDRVIAPEPGSMLLLLLGGAALALRRRRD